MYTRVLYAQWLRVRPTLRESRAGPSPRLSLGPSRAEHARGGRMERARGVVAGGGRGACMHARARLYHPYMVLF
eukprot:COSAG02_NODE_5242_length_4511_cov_8.198549_1_plen_74_part_00